MSEKEQLIKRWDTFLEKIAARCDMLISQANAGTEKFVPQLLFDSNAINNAWTGIKDQIYQLNNKMEDAWDKFDVLMDDADFSEKENDKERHKLYDTSIDINWNYEKNYILAMAKAAKQILSNVKNHIDENKMHNCTQCGNPLNISVYSFRAKNVKCNACGTVNTYHPDGRITALESWVIEPLANEHAIEEKKAQFYADEKRRDLSDSLSDDDKQNLINVRQTFIKKYYQFMIDQIPEKSEFLIRQRDERLKWAEKVKR